jgi:hypothetical protein
MATAELNDVIRDLASIRSDSLSGKKRKELMEVAIKSLELSTVERKALAHRKGRWGHVEDLPGTIRSF